MKTIVLLSIGLQRRTLEHTWQPESQSVSMTTEYRKRFFRFLVLSIVIYSFAIEILGITMDNASNNHTLVDELSEILDDFQGEPTRVCCFAHIFNLVVKVCFVLLRAFFPTTF